MVMSGSSTQIVINMSSQILKDPKFGAKVGSCLLVCVVAKARALSPTVKDSPDGPYTASSEPFLSFDEVGEGRYVARV